jgi:nitroreductase
VIKIFPFLNKKMKRFANRLDIIAKNRIPWLDQAPYYVIIAEKKWFPPVEKSSIAHVMQNMRLTATDLGLGFQLVSATSLMSNNAKFLQLVWLKKWRFQIDWCVIWYPANKIELVKNFDLKKIVTRVK